MNQPYTLHTLSNGLRLVIEQMPGVRSAAAGFMIRTGARDETRAQAGVSHFLEHMMFKGTRKRNWRQITIDFDRMGSSYNAYTGEERTMYYGWVRMGDIGTQLELLADMMRPLLPAEEFDMEKKVILEEIAMSKDSLDHLAMDFLQEKIFAGHPLSWPILGYDDTVQNLTREQMHAYYAQRYTPDNMLLFVAGRVDPAEVIAQAEALCGDWQPAADQPVRVPPHFHAGESVMVVERFKQQVLILAYPAVPARDPLSETASSIATILGGDNSRFYWNIVQKGLAPRAGAYYLDHVDSGVMLLYAICQPETAPAVVDALRSEAARLFEEGALEHELARVRNKRRTALAAEAEAPYHRLSQLIDDMEYHGAPRTVEERLAEIDAVSVEGIGQYLRAKPIHTGEHLSSVGPRHWPEDVLASIG